MVKEFVTKDGREKIVVNDAGEFVEVTRSEKWFTSRSRRFKVVDSIAIPSKLVDSVITALQATRTR